MGYIDVIDINDVKKNFHSIFLDATKSKVIICQDLKSTAKDRVSILGTDILLELLAQFTFKPEIQYDKETELYDIQLPEIGQFAYAETKEKAKEELIDIVEIYIDDYIKNVDMFIKQNRYKEHYPYILKLAHLENRDAITREIFC
jgi:hypothetical protein